MKLTEYSIRSEKIKKGIRFAIISDLHDNDPKRIIPLLHEARPDYILAAGDIFEHVDASGLRANERAYELLSAAAQIAPTFYAMGNHEIGGTHSWMFKLKIVKRPEAIEWTDEGFGRLLACGIHFLDDNYVEFDGIRFGGLSSGFLNADAAPRLDWLSDFCDSDAPKVLICHHPEYYKKYLSELDIDLTVSGHAHGGQWRFFGRGVFAPGQGFFPKYTAGIYDGRVAVSRGMKKSGLIPRLFNPTEVVVIDVN